jgi:hypothetical protein
VPQSDTMLPSVKQTAKGVGFPFSRAVKRKKEPKDRSMPMAAHERQPVMRCVYVSDGQTEHTSSSTCSCQVFSRLGLSRFWGWGGGGGGVVYLREGGV